MWHRNGYGFSVEISVAVVLSGCLILIASALSMDEGSRLRRSHTQEGLLLPGARSAPGNNRRKTVANAAGVSAQERDKITIVQGIKHSHSVSDPYGIHHLAG